ncbi:uncharacterized protein [Asterias amurensis]|uniref:uncharacterized protein isoform X2 n=1 Tax=Asterias amurensis TaxID=7602 RepID=UPI003AB731CC
MMKPKRKKQRPVTEDSMRKTRKNDKVISKLHTFNKEIEKIQDRRQQKKSSNFQKFNILKKQIEQLGGLDAYQIASKQGEARHGNLNTAKWVLQKLKEHNIRVEKGLKFKLLDVGALDYNYSQQKKWIDCSPIDLNPQNSRVIKADFFTFQNDDPVQFDICKPKGYLFVILPLACLENSRYMGHDLLNDILESLGFTLITSHNSRRLSFKMYQYTGETGKRKTFPKTLTRNGIKCNNFSITLS